MVNSNFQIEYMDSMLTQIKDEFKNRFTPRQKKEILRDVFKKMEANSETPKNIKNFRISEDEICICELKFLYPLHKRFFGHSFGKRRFRAKWEFIVLTADQTLVVMDAQKNFKQEYNNFQEIWKRQFPNLTKSEFEEIIKGSDLVLYRILIQMQNSDDLI